MPQVKAIFEANKGEISGVILEPVVGNSGFIQPTQEFLEGLREITKKVGGGPVAGWRAGHALGWLAGLCMAVWPCVGLAVHSRPGSRVGLHVFCVPVALRGRRWVFCPPSLPRFGACRPCTCVAEHANMLTLHGACWSRRRARCCALMR